jgi:general secretion pathway protein E
MTRTGQAQARAKTEAALPTRITLQWLLAEMVTAGLIPPEAPGKLKFPPAKKGDSGNPHPLVVAAFQDWHDRRQPSNRLTLEALTQWLAHRVRLPYLRIDPLSLEVGKLTEVVPYAYASRVGILPVKSGHQGILAELRRLATRSGMRSLRLTGAEKVAHGLTSVGEVIALTPDPRKDD